VSFILSYFSKIQIATFIPISYFLIIIWLYFFGIADYLHLGVISLLPLALAAFIFSAIKFKNFISKKRLLELTSPSVVVFVTVSTWMFKHSQHMRFKEWDEFSHWGPAVKSMFLFDKIGPYSPAQLVFPEYPPGLSLFSYFVNRIGKSWDEADVYWAYQLLVVSLIVAALANLKWKNISAVVLSFLLMALTATFFFGSFQTVYADPLLALIFGLSLIQASSKVFFENKWNLFNFGITVFILSITKDIGIFLGFISILALLSNYVVSGFERKISLKRKLISGVKILLATTIPVILGKLAWKYALDKFDIKSGRDIFTILKDFTLGSSSNMRQPYWDDVINSFISKTFHQSITGMNGYPISAFKWFLIFSIFLLVYVFSAKIRLEQIRRISNSSIILIGFFGYLGVLLFLYLTSFSQSEALGLASYERYVTTYLAGIAFYVGYLAMDSMNNFSLPNSTNLLTFSWLLIILLQASPWNLMSYVASPNAASDAMRAQFDSERQMIADMNFNVEDNVWFIAEHTVGFEFYLFQYELLPASIGRSPWSIGSPYGPGDLWTDTNITKEVWDKRLNDFDYVFVHSANEVFLNEFGSLFEDPGTLSRPTIYQIKHRPEGNLLVKVR
jgi:hypothetical protein